MELNEDQKKDLIELQSIQQQMQLLVMQKQQLLVQQGELDKASEEIGKATGGQLYRFAGGIMIPKEKSVLESELKEEKESVEVRLNALAKQEKKLRERFEELRKKLEKSFPQLGESASASY
ncbi:MAG: prefoldin subunit beta [Candidatus Norongarragalinales archaeon]